MAAECYALGLDPADVTDDFRIVSIEMVDGKPKVEWEPKVNRWTGAEIQAVLKGAETLNGEWKSVEGATVAEKAAMRPCRRQDGGVPSQCAAKMAWPLLCNVRLI